MICYAKFEVGLHGLKFKTQAELDAFAFKIKAVLESCHPESHSLMGSDVVVDLVETAGLPEA